jgi:AbrB family looped-hinge helix DNA binding protein
MPRPKARAAESAARIKVSPTGRLSLPADLRREVGLERGGTVVVELKGGAIELRTLGGVLAEARERARKLAGKKLSVDDFLKFRRSVWKE